MSEHSVYHALAIFDDKKKMFKGAQSNLGPKKEEVFYDFLKNVKSEAINRFYK